MQAFIKPFVLAVVILVAPVASICQAHGDHEHHAEMGLTENNGRIFVVRTIHKMTLRDFKLGAGKLDDSWRKTRVKHVVFSSKTGNSYSYIVDNPTTQESLTVTIDAIGKPVSARLRPVVQAQ